MLQEVYIFTLNTGLPNEVTYTIFVDFDTEDVQCIPNVVYTDPATLTALELGADTGFVYATRTTGVTTKKAVAILSFPFAEIQTTIAALDPVCDVQFTTSSVRATNANNNGSITVTPTSGGTDWQYSLDSIIWQSSNVFNSLFPGLYSVYVMNEIGCMANKTVTLGNEEVLDEILTEIPYQDVNNICPFFRLIVGDDITVISEPIQWDSVRIIGDRDMEYHGYKYKYSDGNIELGFDCDAGRNLIKEQFELHGSDAEILFQYGYSYEGISRVLFPGKLDMNTYKPYPDRVTCTVDLAAYDATFSSRFDAPVSMMQTKTFDDSDVVPPSPLSLELHAKEILTKILVNKTDSTYYQPTDVFMPDSYEWGILPDTIGSTFGEITDYYEYPLQANILNPLNVDQYHIDFKNAGELTGSFSWNIDIDLRIQAHAFDVDFAVKMFWVVKKFNFSTQSHTTYIHQVGNTYAATSPAVTLDRHEFNLTGTGDLSGTYAIGDQLFIYILMDTFGVAQSFMNTSWELEQNSFNLNLQYLEASPASPAKVWFIDDVLRQVLNVIGDNQYGLKSSYYERIGAGQLVDGCGALRVETNGYQIRQFEVADRPLKISFDTVIKSLRAQDCIGINYNGNIVRIERADYFYRDKQILVIADNIKKYYEEVALDFLPNEIEIGYERFKESGYNSLDEFNTKHQLLTPIKKNKKKLTLFSQFIKSGYSIEESRRNQFSKTPSSSVNDDEENFEINVVRNGSSYATEKNENFAVTNNVISPETSYNLRSTPHRMLYNWFIWLKAIFFYKPDTDKITHTNVIQNGTLQTQFNSDATCRVGDLDRNLITENGHDLKTVLASTPHIYQPEWMHVTCRLSPDKVQVLNLALSGQYGTNKDYGYVIVQKPDSTWQAGYVYHLSYNYSSEECELKLLKKYPSPVIPIDENCCEYLLVNGCYLKVNTNKIIA